MSHLTRRNFLNQSAGFVTAAALASAAKLGLAAQGDPMNVALIGPGGMGSAHLNLLAVRKDLRVKYVCDPDANRAASAAKIVEQNGGSAKAVKDMREVFDDKSVEAVWIATPDHWHSPAAILAVEAGKHVYVEKPVSHNIREGRLLLEAARKNKKVVQVGTQSRSTPTVARAIEIVKSGEIGDVLVAKAWNSQLRGSIGHQQPSEPPANLDFELWLGPAPDRPYQSNLLPGVWRWWYDFGCGDIGNDGVHDIDVALWGLDESADPTSVACLGGKYFFDDDQQFPDTMQVTFEYPGDNQVGSRRMLIYEQRLWSTTYPYNVDSGAEYIGTKGKMFISKRGKFEVRGERNSPLEARLDGIPKSEVPQNQQNWINCIKNGGVPNANVEIAHRTATAAHLGNIATRLGRSIRFDPQEERIVGDDEANALLSRNYRDGGHWGIPEGV
jgi:predicted dehydrogenase